MYFHTKSFQIKIGLIYSSHVVHKHKSIILAHVQIWTHLSQHPWTEAIFEMCMHASVLDHVEGKIFYTAVGAQYSLKAG